MIVSLNWLRRYVDLPESPRDIAAALTALGFEVESLRVLGEGAKGVVAAEVRACARHPEADRLSVCRVFDGKDEVQVVCGAPNVAAGQKVLFAPVGAELPGGVVLRKAKLRGQESFGMICAEDELGLGDSHEGILVLDPSVVPGTSLESVPGLCDAVLELNVTPNRPDALGHVGVARELAARYGRLLRLPQEPLREEGPEVGSLAALELDPGQGCGCYVGRVIEDVTIGPSPAWLAAALKAVGKKPINNVVDLTNFALLEWGQPSHAFDLDKLAGRKIHVRRARPGEKLRTLDGVDRALDARDLVIADGEKPQVLAGVMGGEDSGVSPSTRRVFLEAACFDPGTVRSQARRHGLQSDSSFRFERGVDPLHTPDFCDYLAALIARCCGGKVAQGRLEAFSPEHPRKPREVPLRPARAEALLGVPCPADMAEKLLGALAIEAAGRDADGSIRFRIPGFRGDLTREADLIEEVARRMDYNAIPSRLPALPLRPAPLPAGETLAREIRHCLRDLGLCETVSLRFTSRKALERLRLPEGDPRLDPVALRNPLSEDWSVLPTTSLPGLLQALERNQNMQEYDVRLFELGRAFFRRPRTGERDPGIREEALLGIALTGDWRERPWDGQREPAGFLRLKGLVENLLDRLRVPARWQYGSAASFLHPAESAALLGPDGETLGVLGSLHPGVQQDYSLRQAAAVAELRLEPLMALKRAPRFVPYSVQTGTERDVNVVVAEALAHADIVAALPPDIPHLQELRLNSVYRGQGIPEGHKALHYRFTYRHPERALTDEEVNAVQENLHRALLRHPGIRIK